MFRAWITRGVSGLLCVAVLGFGCAPRTEGQGAGASGEQRLTGIIRIDGSSTVAPIANGLAELFKGEHPQVQVSVASTGTGAGMQKFLRGESDIATASRPIAETERASAREAGIEYFEIPIAYDGICIVVAVENQLLPSITLEKLNEIWRPGSQVMRWSQIAPGLPDRPLKLYGPTQAHGTWEYFNEVVNGKKDATRADYQGMDEYNALVSAIAGDPFALGYVGISYYLQNRNRLKAVLVDFGAGPVEPSVETIMNGTYSKLSRPLLLYVNKKSYDENPTLRAFVAFSLRRGQEVVEAVQYVPLSPEVYALALENVRQGRTGSRMQRFQPGMTPAELLKLEGEN